MTEAEVLQIIPVEPGEADWCVTIVEELLDHYFEAPKRRAAKIAEANAKRAGKTDP